MIDIPVIKTLSGCLRESDFSGGETRPGHLPGGDCPCPILHVVVSTEPRRYWHIWSAFPQKPEYSVRLLTVASGCVSWAERK